MGRIDVVAIAGHIASGKSSIAAALAAESDSVVASFGDVLRAHATARGLSPSREVLQDLGASWVGSDPEGLTHALLISVGWTSGQRLVVDGVRHVQVWLALCEMVAPARTALVFVDASFERRRDRVRHHHGQELLPRWETHEAEAEIDQLRGHAAYIADNNGSLADSIRDTIQWIRSAEV